MQVLENVCNQIRTSALKATHYRTKLPTFCTHLFGLKLLRKNYKKEVICVFLLKKQISNYILLPMHGNFYGPWKFSHVLHHFVKPSIHKEGES